MIVTDSLQELYKQPRRLESTALIGQPPWDSKYVNVLSGLFHA